MTNFTSFGGFILNAFSSITMPHALYFLIFLIIYIITVLGNIVIIFVSIMDYHLQTPMYFLLSNLSIMDICYTSITVPQMMAILFLDPPAISLPACICQLYFFLTLAAAESSLLATMAYDRYVAICIPLRYVLIMSKKACIQMTAGTWLTGCIFGAIHTVNTFSLPFCGPKILNHYFCDIPPLLKLSCISTFFNEALIFAIGGILMIGCFLLIFGSYMQIFASVFKIPKGNGRGKAFSTCISHLIVVLLFYGSGSFMYLRPKSDLLADKEWILSIFYSCLTPLLNPLIYSLRNKDIQMAIKKQINHKIKYICR